MSEYRTFEARRQQGAALAVSLILLLVMTIVGVAAMNGARMEISMAGLMQQEQEALRRSERGLSDAEVRVENIVGTLGLFEFDNVDEIDGVVEDGMYGPDADLEDVSGRDWSAVESIQGSTYPADSIHDDNRMVIQYLGSEIIPGENVGEDGEPCVAGCQAFVYRISSRSAAGSKSVRIIESTYTTAEAP